MNPAAMPPDKEERVNGKEPGESGGITCGEVAERLYEYLDSELDTQDAPAVREHLRVCEACYPRLAFEEAFRALVRRVEEGESASDDLRRQVLDVLTREGFEGSR